MTVPHWDEFPPKNCIITKSTLHSKKENTGVCQRGRRSEMNFRLLGGAGGFIPVPCPCVPDYRRW